MEQVQLRIMATQTLGEMFADKHGMDLVQKYPTTWNHWLGRKNDKIVTVRQTWVETMKGVVTNLPEMRKETEEALNLKLLDPDDKIRAAVCKLYGQLDYETALHHVSVDQLKAVAGRGLDRKVRERWEGGVTVTNLVVNSIVSVWKPSMPLASFTVLPTLKCEPCGL